MCDIMIITYIVEIIPHEQLYAETDNTSVSVIYYNNSQIHYNMTIYIIAAINVKFFWH